jgi:sugar phosphate isomerase/epimerase
MRVAVSSIAWTWEQAETLRSLLLSHGADGVEASPGLFEKPLAEVSPREALELRRFWEGNGLPFVAMQGLFFNAPPMSLFGSSAERAAMAAYLRKVFVIAGKLGAGPLVFGSPRNRRAGALNSERAFALAADFFSSLAPAALDQGCVLCIEANAREYGCDFITRHAEAVRLTKAVGRKGFGFHLDTGVMQMNGETPEETGAMLKKENLAPAHVHVSQPFLAPVGDMDPDFHGRMRAVLQSAAYQGVVSIEMKAPARSAETPGQLVAALERVRTAYR